MAKNISQLPTDLMTLGSKLSGKILELLPPVVATEGQKHFEESWDNQGFTDKDTRKWKGRKAPSPMNKKSGGQTSAYSKWAKKDAGRAILVSHQTDTKGTHLKDSIRAQTTPRQVIFATDKPYAQVHNEGGRSGRGKGFMMPKRQFMGPSAQLDKKIEQKLTKEITKYLNSLKL